MRLVRATYAVVTPMFLGDSSQAASAMRPSSVKGALRFWWRALTWAEALRTCPGDQMAAMRWLHQREAHLFGASAADERGGQGVFLLQVRAETGLQNSSAQPFGNPGPGQLYLLGQGLASFRDGVKRSAFTKELTFEVLLRFKPGTPDKDAQELLQTLRIFGLLGSLGSRARHGMGSVALTGLFADEAALPVPENLDAYAAALGEVLGDTRQADLPLYTAFSKHTLIDVSAKAADALRLLEKVGATQQLYRLFGRYGMVGKVKARKLFEGDHDLMFKAARRENIRTAPDRAVFGLPHNYYFSSIKKNVGVNARIGNSSEAVDTRRASPLLLHIHPLAGEFVAVNTLMPALFLPPQGGLAVNRQRDLVPMKPKWSVIYRYLDEYQADTNYKSLLRGERVND